VLLSMTGHGAARRQTDALNVAVEVRSVNNRYLKLTLRAPEPFNLLETEFEKVIRRFVRRGTILVQLRVDRPASSQDFRLNVTALQSYLQQIRTACAAMSPPTDPGTLLGQVLALPGVAPESGAMAPQVDDEWPVIEQVVVEALERLQAFRREEGARMARELLTYRVEIAGWLEMIRAQAPHTVATLRDRLLERVRGLLADSGAAVNSIDLIREVAIGAERGDVAEEIVRLNSHLEQFERIVRTESDAPGRKLEFVVQEMGRETNTIGSKANDVEVSRHVVEIKATLEKVRELIQNVE
jgi:uncharacterized protein (TIGR00255 family)